MDFAEEMHGEEKKVRNRRVVGTILFVGVLLLFAAFTWKVFGYYRQIQAGTLDVSTLSFGVTRATGEKLLAIAKAAPGSGALATQDDPSLGSADAKLTIVQFADFGCPYSQEESHVLRALAQKYPNDVRLIYRDFPLTDLHPGADLAAQAGECAQEQGKFWEYHDILYRNSGEFTSEELIDYASETRLDVRRFRTCLESSAFADEVAQDLADGAVAGVVGTPTLFLNGQKVEGAVPFSVFTDIVEAFIAE